MRVQRPITSRDAWDSALVGLAAVLRAGGRLAFESRNPLAKEWERWTSEHRRTVEDPVLGRIETWSELEGVEDGIVTYTIHYAFAATNEEVVAATKLRFRSEDEITQSLDRAGFTIEHVYGDWDRRPPGGCSGELIFVAARGQP